MGFLASNACRNHGTEFFHVIPWQFLFGLVQCNSDDAIERTSFHPLDCDVLYRAAGKELCAELSGLVLE